MAITCYPVASTWVEFVVDLDGVLAVQFKDGFAARYAGTNGTFVTAMLSSASKGRFVGTVLKGWPYTPIVAPCPCQQSLEATGSKGTFILTGYQETTSFNGSTATGIFTLVGKEAPAHTTLVVATGSFAIDGKTAETEVRTPAARITSDYAPGQTVRVTANGTGDITVRWPDNSEQTLSGGGEFSWTSTGTGQIYIFGTVTELRARDASGMYYPYAFSEVDLFANTIELVDVAETYISTLDLSNCASEIILEVYSCPNLTTIDMGGNALKGNHAYANANDMSASDLNAFFTSLGTNVNLTADIEVQSNPGSTTCDTSIAEAKGYTVFNDY